MKIQERLLKESPVQERLNAAKLALARYEAECIRYGDELNADTTVGRLRQELVNAKDIEQVFQLRDEIAKHASPEAGTVASAIRRIVINEFYVPAQSAVRALADACLSALSRYHDEAVKAEADFLKENGLPTTEKTALSRVHESALKHVREFVSGIQTPHLLPIGFLPTASSPLLAWLGVTDIAA